MADKKKNQLSRGDSRKLEDWLIANAEQITGTTLESMADKAGNAIGVTVTAANVRGAITQLDLPIEWARKPRGGEGRVNTPLNLSRRISRQAQVIEKLERDLSDTRERVAVLEELLSGDGGSFQLSGT